MAKRSGLVVVVGRALVAAWLVVGVAACSGNPACASAEENLPRCGQTYYGDDNCELLTEDCSDDDLTVLDALFQCIGDNCSDVSVCEIHVTRLSDACVRSFSGG